MMKLVTRTDFDGLACGVLLRELGITDGYRFTHPKDLQDGLFKVGEDDCLANVPYVDGCGLWFDHHSSETDRLGDFAFSGDKRVAPSCARVVYEYYGGVMRLPWFAEMVDAADKLDSADLTAEEILNPSDWTLLGFLTDPRTGLGRFRDFRLDIAGFIELLTEECRFKGIKDVLKLPDVAERADFYFDQSVKFRAMVEGCSTVHDNVVVTDLRGHDTIYAGNRFMIYSVFPQQNVSIWVVDGKDKRNCSIAVGRSIVNRSSEVNIGALLLNYGGGGHPKMGTCQVEHGIADDIIEALVEQCGDKFGNH